MKSLIGILSLSMALLLDARAELTVASLPTITTDIAKNVGGEAIELIPIMKPGIDPHEFQPPRTVLMSRFESMRTSFLTRAVADLVSR